MKDNRRIPREIAPTDATLDGPALAVLTEDAASDSHSPCVHLVEGSGPGMSAEMRSVLRSRLRASALLIFAGFTAFWLWWTVESLLGYQPLFAGPWFVYFAQLGTAAVIGFFGLGMCRKCDIPLWSLRFQEAVIFGLPAAFFALRQAVVMSACAEAHNFVPTPLVPWLLIIFLYALFIPNTWRRAAPIIGTMALAPIAVTLAVWQLSPACHQALAQQHGFFVELILVMAIAVLSSVVGVHTIGTLRREAFKARQLGQYNLRHLIGAGGMGEVYLAEHRLMKRPCAIKLIRPDRAGDPRILARFEREVKASAKLSHWNNIDIFDYGHADNGTFYYVMEYLPGMNLQELVQRYGPLPPERAIHLLAQTCDALGEAHAAGMVHRDIKPANIYAAHRGGLYDVAKLLDFGLVKPISTVDSTQLTVEGSITGSPLFMSPEQATGDGEPDARSDIYCLGAVGYFLLTGQPPFYYEQPIKVLLAHARETPAPPSQVEPSVPPDLEAVVMKCLEKEPEDRFQNVLEVRDALLGCEAAGQWTWQQAAQWWQANGAREAAPAEPAIAVPA